MLEINKIMSNTNKLYNEDSFGFTDDSFWVIDGATGLYKNSIEDNITDAQWYVREINVRLKDKITDKTKSLKYILKECIAEVFELYKKQSKNNTDNKEVYPSASIIIVREFEDYVEYLSLGDCTLLINNNSHITRILDESVPNLDAILVEELQKIMKEKKIYISEARAELNELCIKHRKMKNTKDGYWILEFNEEAIENSIYGTLNKNQISDIVIMSDGYYRLKDTFNYYASDSDFFNDLKIKNCEELFNIITDFENTDENCLIHPRDKQRDDVTFLYITNK